MAETQHVSDDRIGNAVALELRWLSRVDSTHIATSVSGGIVTLTGTAGYVVENLEDMPEVRDWVLPQPVTGG